MGTNRRSMRLKGKTPGASSSASTPSTATPAASAGVRKSTRKPKQPEPKTAASKRTPRKSTIEARKAAAAADAAAAATPSARKSARSAAAKAAATTPPKQNKVGRPPKKAKTTKSQEVEDTPEGSEKFPAFDVLNQDGKTINTGTLQHCVIFLYPKANTPGCTTQACGFRDNYEELNKLGYEVYGLSYDTPNAQNKWKTKHNMPYNFLCDKVDNKNGNLIKSIGCHKAPKSVIRSHFIIGAGGVVLESEIKVSPKNSIANAIDFCKKNPNTSAAAASSAENADAPKQKEKDDTEMVDAPVEDVDMKDADEQTEDGKETKKAGDEAKHEKPAEVTMQDKSTGVDTDGKMAEVAKPSDEPMSEEKKVEKEKPTDEPMAEEKQDESMAEEKNDESMPEEKKEESAPGEKKDESMPEESAVESKPVESEAEVPKEATEKTKEADGDKPDAMETTGETKPEQKPETSTEDKSTEESTEKPTITGEALLNTTTEPIAMKQAKEKPAISEEVTEKTDGKPSVQQTGGEGDKRDGKLADVADEVLAGKPVEPESKPAAVEDAKLQDASDNMQDEVAALAAATTDKKDVSMEAKPEEGGTSLSNVEAGKEDAEKAVESKEQIAGEGETKVDEKPTENGASIDTPKETKAVKENEPAKAEDTTKEVVPEATPAASTEVGNGEAASQAVAS